MNIIEAFDAALPELPAAAHVTYPKLDPRIIHKEHIEQGLPVVLAKAPGSDTFLRLAPEDFRLLQMFDGERSFAQIAEASGEEAGVAYTEEAVRDFATYLREHCDVFYKSPLEKNVTLKQKLGSQRQKRKRFRIADVTDIPLHTWPRADEYLTRLQPYVRFAYTTWFTLLMLSAFAVMAWMWADRFGEIWSDSFQFYNFTQKGFGDLVEFWILFGTMAFFHESAHGMTCKHFGGNVEKIQFILLWFAPTFVCDVTQVWIVGGRKARVATVLAGIYMDLILCAAATLVWWGTATGMWMHDVAYKVMMVTGIGVTLLNLNPLIKLDGYYLFSELTGEVDLKERATLYFSGWMRQRVWHLPAETEYVSRRRRFFYLLYAVLSGVYSYGLMALICLFVYHVMRHYWPDWALLPGLVFAYFIFRSRLRTLERFMKDLYLDKRESLRAWLTPGRAAAIAAALLLVLFAPLWPDFVQGAFVLEPSQSAVIRAQVPGSVTEVLVQQGQTVAAGSALVRMRNLPLESEAAQANADLRVAQAHVTETQLRYADYGPAEQQRRQAEQLDRSLADQVAHLQVATPIAGVVVTPRLNDLPGSYLTAGTQILEIADLSSLRVRIYIPEFDMREVRLGAPVRIQTPGSFRVLSGSLAEIAPAASLPPEGLAPRDLLQGIRPPQYYVGTVLLPNPGQLRDGMTGTAKIFVRHSSLAGFAWRFFRDLFSRRLW
ncbi:MAG TPA: HlyD family efflux transporter periplasmic adaptor subunit [Terriglobales bacterium]|jgi:putative peptide zinc metalloprotease protein|nr:HlyD family efflux transporter periplasmic adaptor subunit [Terriglobales bacterium]